MKIDVLTHVQGKAQLSQRRYQRFWLFFFRAWVNEVLEYYKVCCLFFEINAEAA